MAFKLNISDKSGKSYKFEAEAESLIDKELGDKVQGKELREDLDGFEFEITGATDKSGFAAKKEVPGVGLKRVLLGYGFGMHRKPKREGKFKTPNHKPKGLRLRKTVRGKVISSEITQINFKVIKAGKKTLEEIFNPKTEEAPAEAKTEAQ